MDTTNQTVNNRAERPDPNSALQGLWGVMVSKTKRHIVFMVFEKDENKEPTKGRVFYYSFITKILVWLGPAHPNAIEYFDWYYKPLVELLPKQVLENVRNFYELYVNEGVAT